MTDLVVVGSGFFGLTIAERAATELGLSRPRPRAPAPPRRQRLQRDRPRDRDRGPPLRRAPVPHLERAGLGVRQPVHRLHRLPAPGLRPSTRARSTRCRSTSARSASSSAGRCTPGRGARPGRRAGQPSSTPTTRGQPRGEGDLADRPPALRGVHPRLHRQAVADRPQGAARRRSSPGCRSATPSTTATSTTPTRACRSTATPRGSSGWPTTRRSRSSSTPTSSTRKDDLRRPGPGRLHRPGRPVLRLLRGPAGLAHARLRARGAPDAATSRARR